MIKTQCLVSPAVASLLHTACALKFAICFRRHTVIQLSQCLRLISAVCARHASVRKMGWVLIKSYKKSRFRYKKEIARKAVKLFCLWSLWIAW